MTDTKYHFTESGLDYIYLTNGVKTHIIDGETYTEIENQADLLKAIAKMIVETKPYLEGQDVRFLRSMLDLSQTGMGNLIGRKRDAIAKWESKEGRKEQIDQAAAELLKLKYARTVLRDKDMLKVLHQLDELDAQEFGDRLVMSEDDDGWKAAA